jgi:hypothetical protein
MVKNNCLYFIFLSLLGFTTYAQKVNNIYFRQDKSNIIVSYDLETKTPCKVNLFVSTNGGKTWQGPLIKVTGDVGTKIASGNHNITWNVLEEYEELRGNKIQFQIRAYESTIETVVIGTQEWTTKNLNVSRYRNGDEIPEVKDPKKWAKLTTGAWCYYNNDPENGATYGKLYNWYAVNDLRGLAPEGFHIPTDTELKKLTDIKRSNGFAGLAGGNLSSNVSLFDYIGSDGFWWSSSETSTTNAWRHNLVYYSGNVSSLSSTKSNGYSVRCLKD